MPALHESPMKRSRLSRTAKHTPDTEQLIQTATGLGMACCRTESDFWEIRLIQLVNGCLEDGDEATLTQALDHLYSRQERAYEALADIIEMRCESGSHSTKGTDDLPTREFSLQLFVAPVLAWSRFTIPSGPIGAAHLANLRVHLQAHIFAQDARICLADFLFSPDQLPQSYCETLALTEKLGKSALHSRDLHMDPAKMPETASFLSDTRYLLGVAVIQKGSALFRWQEEDGDRNEALKQWRGQGGETLRQLLPGCACELLLPQAYHAGCRNADRQSRPYSLRASAAYLSTTLNLTPAGLRTIVAPFYDRNLEEYRIGFTLKDSADVIHGVVWPMLDAEDDSSDMGAQIEAILREIGIGEITLLDHRLPLEYCDDCGTPLYPNPEGEPVHAELPEEQAESVPRHLH